MTDPAQEELERTYDIDGPARLPRLTGVDGVARVRHHPPTALEAVYFDTADRDLSAHHVTLRRRTGGADAGWHVVIGRGERRIEMRSPPGSEDLTVPRRIRDLVHVHVRGKALTQIARLDTLRSTVDLLDSQGHLLAEVRDDQVAARAVGLPAESSVQHWREWVVEVSEPGSQGLLDGVGSVLQAAGARASTAGATVERVVGATADPLDPQAPLAGHGNTAGHDGGPLGVRSVLTATVRAQLAVLKDWDPLVRCDVEDSVHQYRVSCRTLRSLLQTYAPLLDREVTGAVVRDLKTLGRLLSVARDAEVVRDLVAQRIEALPGGGGGPVAGLIPGRTVKRLQRSQATTYDAAHARQLKRMRGTWYAEVLNRLDALALEVPLHADLPAQDEADAVEAMVPLAAGQVDAVLALAATVGAGQDHETRLELMHEVRKEAKRLRYAVTAVQEATGLGFGAELVERMQTAKGLQAALGEHRDSVMFQAHVLATSRAAATRGEDTFGYGVLFSAEFARQSRTEAEAEALVAQLAGGRGADRA
ncbi:CYTH and CHAD domain-containing protein [Microbacterium sp. A93]|uniref:CYTH and CHAD domain-containing protein n=1 Tax=Microbacterium sp. A93 TaxID=3450716 RepID=UPI003F43F0CE